MRREAGQVADALTLTEKLDGDARALLHGEHETALRGAVELREHETR